MNLIDETYHPIPNTEDAIDYNYFEFDVKENDFFLKYKPSWQHIKTTGYTVYIDGGETIIPSSFYIMIADIEGSIDYIKIDEIISRPFEAFTVRNDFEKDMWQILPIKITNVDIVDFYFPNTRNLVPIDIQTNRAIMVSQIDMYNKTTGLTFTDIV